LKRERPILVRDRPLEHLAVEADRGRLLSRVEADEDRFRVDGFAPVIE
jgi:hypothetical protein